MGNLLSRLFLLSTLIWHASVAYAVEKNVEAKIGKSSISIPVPKGFADSSAMFPSVFQFGETMTAKSNRLLGFFISDDDVKTLLSQSRPELHRYFMVQTLRAMEDSQMSSEEFSDVREKLKTQYKKIFRDNHAMLQAEIDRAVSQVGKVGDTKQNLSLKLGELSVVDVMSEEKFVTLIAKTLVKVAVNGEIKEIPMALGVGTTMAKGKLVYFFCYTRFHSDDDLNWIKTQNQEWMPMLVAANSMQ